MRKYRTTSRICKSCLNPMCWLKYCNKGFHSLTVTLYLRYSDNDCYFNEYEKNVKGSHINQKVSLQLGYVFRTHTTMTWCWHNIWVRTYIYFVILGCITNSYKHNKCLTVIVLTILKSIDSFSSMKYPKIDYPSPLWNQDDTPPPPPKKKKTKECLEKRT